MSGVIRTVSVTRRAVVVADGFWRRRTGLIVPGLMLVIGLALVVGTVTMRVPDTATSPGPQVFPAIVAALVLIVAVLLAVDVLRKPEAATVEIAQPAAPGDVDDLDLDGEPVDRRPTSNRRALLGALGTVVVFIAALTPLGWLLAGAVLFWGIARSLGSRRPAFDVFLALAISSIVQLAFSAGLGLNLPPGILEGIF
ncbi:tripartite tricarboxylate transporter TctB family protein [Frigoribacterium sp. PhB24]|uniref:tripartite tricarboxylate transporter TctB family protein n=1 Tax=Frigoribacterium sp. PhB24 TaxID=2485204 RepID=UPI000FB6C06E|nr:tripartite tricarboxylate transporter TctB family protein [Frigoribacterium sp. PhB24]ROS54117.1 putative tricarboxylic transport membrane protein [Frigoribacterium sp. PhB24]